MLAALADEQAPTWAKHDGTESERQVPATVTVSERHDADIRHTESLAPERSHTLMQRLKPLLSVNGTPTLMAARSNKALPG
jgi:hypothetical protein